MRSQRRRWRAVGARALGALLCATAHAFAEEPARGRRAPPPTSLVDSLGEADAVAVVRVAAAAEARVELAVLESCKGAPGPGRLAVACESPREVEPLQQPACPGVGALALAFLAVEPGAISPLALPYLGLVPLDPRDQPEICAVAAELELASGDAGALVAALQRATALRSGALRRALLGDLALRIRAVDLAWLRRTIADRGAPEDLRLWAAIASASLDLPELPSEVAALLDRDESVALRQAALRAHGTRGDAAELEVLRRGLGDPDPGVRLAAVDAFTAARSVPLLARHFGAESAPEVRLAIVGKLGSAGTPAALDALRGLRAGATEPELREMIDLALAAAESRAPGAGGR